MAKRGCFILIIILVAFYTKAQVPAIKSNTTEEEKKQSIIYKAFANQYDFLIAYSSDSYWSSNMRAYKILAIKNGSYLKGTYISKSKGNNKWAKPVIKFEKANIDTAREIVKYFNNSKFWSLNRDTLNIHEKKTDTLTWSLGCDDCATNKFETISTDGFSIIESIAPETYLEFLPELKSREVFIKCRNWFLSKYKKL